MKNTQIQIGQCASRYEDFVALADSAIGGKLDPPGMADVALVRRW